MMYNFLATYETMVNKTVYITKVYLEMKSVV